MGKTVEFLQQARQDYDQSFDWYAKRSVQAAINFAHAVDATIAKIVDAPTKFAPTAGECRYIALRRFPFRIVFRRQVDGVVIIAIAHAKRRPNYWLDAPESG